MKVIFLTNVIRRMGMMQQTMEKLQQEGKLDNACACRWITDATAWDDKWHKELAGSKLVIMKWMGTGLDTPFLQRCVSLLKQLRLPFYIDAAGSKEGELAQGLTPEQLAVIKKYCMFGGEINYSNLWLYLQQLLQGETITVDEPNPIHWCGIYHPRAKKVYTDLAEYQRDFCVSGRPTAGILFYRDEWVWGDLTYQTAIIEELEAQGVNAVCVFSNGMPVEEIHFHEVGTMDAIADVTAVCLLMNRLAPDEVVVSPIHVGSGQVRCAHGILPVPAPATAFILRDVPIYGGTVQGELCTPTGAALLRHFATRFGAMPPMP